MAKKTYTKTYAAEPCHTGQKPYFEIGTPDGPEHYILYAGGRNRDGGWWKQPLAELAMGPHETMTSYNASSARENKTVTPDGFSCAEHIPVYEPPLLIELDFPDFGIPALPASFWYALVEDIKTHNLTHISVQCAGGHGRTGVQLCILLCLLDPAYSAKHATAMDVLRDVRATYCDHAVETYEQIEYVADVIGKEVGEGFTSHKQGGGAWGKASPATGGVGGYKTATYDGVCTCEDKNCLPEWDSKGIMYCQFCGQDIIPDDDDDEEMDWKDAWDNATQSKVKQPKAKQPKAKKPSEAKQTGGIKQHMCPCCNTPNVDSITTTNGCVKCGYTHPPKHMQTQTKTCVECGLDHPLIQYVDDDDVCIGCMARFESHIKVKGNDKSLKVMCNACNKYFPIKCIDGYSQSSKHSPNTPVCFACTSKEQPAKF